MIKMSLPLLLTTFFIILKLIGTITWSWLWVLSPIWIPWVVVGLFASAILTFAGISLVIIFMSEYFNEMKRR